MWHTILIRKDCEVDCKAPNQTRLERMKLVAGDCVDAQVRPHIEPGRPPDDLADVVLGDGCELFAVPYDNFMFGENVGPQAE